MVIDDGGQRFNKFIRVPKMIRGQNACRARRTNSLHMVLMVIATARCLPGFIPHRIAPDLISDTLPACHPIRRRFAGLSGVQYAADNPVLKSAASFENRFDYPAHAAAPSWLIDERTVSHSFHGFTLARRCGGDRTAENGIIGTSVVGQ